MIPNHITYISVDMVKIDQQVLGFQGDLFSQETRLQSYSNNVIIIILLPVFSNQRDRVCFSPCHWENKIFLSKK